MDAWSYHEWLLKAGDLGDKARDGEDSDPGGGDDVEDDLGDIPALQVVTQAGQ